MPSFPAPPLPFLLTILPVLLFPVVPTLSTTTCSTNYCGGETSSLPRQAIRFPFYAASSNQSYRCGYPGFEISCSSNNLPLIDLRSSGQFTLQEVDYPNQLIWITDPDGCLPNRILNLNLSDTPFSGVRNRYFSFFNCSDRQMNSSSPEIFGLRQLECLSGKNHTVFVTVFGSSEEDLLISKCEKIKTVSVPAWWRSEHPVSYASGMDLVTGAIQLSWSEPDCRDCEAEGGSCSLEGNSGLNVTCYNSGSGSGLTRGTMYGLIIGIGVPGLLCMFALILFFGSKIMINRRLPDVGFSLSVFRQPVVVTSGLDEAAIDSYPKKVLGDSGRLSELGNDGTCSICLSEYEPRETLRIIPECKHYFHAQCIDEWLRVKITCPLCRKSPEILDATRTILTSS